MDLTVDKLKELRVDAESAKDKKLNEWRKYKLGEDIFKSLMLNTFIQFELEQEEKGKNQHFNSFVIHSDRKLEVDQYAKNSILIKEYFETPNCFVEYLKNLDVGAHFDIEKVLTGYYDVSEQSWDKVHRFIVIYSTRIVDRGSFNNFRFNTELRKNIQNGAIKGNTSMQVYLCDTRKIFGEDLFMQYYYYMILKLEENGFKIRFIHGDAFQKVVVQIMWD